MDRWNGRVALVTGASAGIGAEICRRLVKHGMIVIGCARNVERIDNIAEEKDVKSSPGRLIARKCDLRNETEILAIFQDLRDNFGRLDVCINNGGLSLDAELLKGDTDKWRNMLDVNVLALCICTREAVKLMREKEIDDGQIIHISSMGGHGIPMGFSGHHFYCGTKHMVKALTECHRRELKELKSKIRISSLSPGMVATEFLKTFYENDPSKLIALENFKSFNPLQAGDMADTIVYILASPPHVEIHDILVRPTDQAV